jgi:hypothetical protein
MKLALRLSIILLLGLSFISCNLVLTTLKYTVSINQLTGGTISIAPQKTSYSEGDQITVTANPNQGYVFSYWGGNLNGIENPTNLTVTGNTIISAVFTPLQNTYTITISNSVGGAVLLSPNKANYASGEVVTVTAVPTTGYTFSAWGGDLTGTTISAMIIIAKNTQITAIFVQGTFVITVNQATGGTITLSPSKPAYALGDVVTVTATSATGYSFSSWGGDVSGTTNPTTITVAKNSTVSASFALIAGGSYTITISGTVGGTIILSPNKTNYNSGDSVSITATPNTGYTFSSWGGDISGSTNPQTFTVTKNMTISATFTQNAYMITINQSAGGIIALSPKNSYYSSGASVTVTATPTAGYIFSSWSGDISGSTNPKTFAVSKNMTISATFTSLAYSMTLNQTTGGTIAISPTKSSYAYGDSAIVTATASAGYSFTSWGGDLTGSANPQTFTVSKNMTISATFTPTELLFQLINGDTEFSVTAGTATSGNVIIPAYWQGLPVTSIGDRAFLNFIGLTSVTIENGINSIGFQGFLGCQGLTSVTIPSSVTSIGEQAFWGCTSLTSVTIPNGVTSIEVYTFGDCFGLANVTLPNSITSIGVWSFQNCGSLTNITIPSSVTFIGGRAFERCNGLTSVLVNPAIPPISDTGEMFSSCPNLTAIKVPAGSVDVYKAAPWWSSYASLIVSQ